MATSTINLAMKFETTVENFSQQAQRHHLRPQTTVTVTVKSIDQSELPWIPYDERIKALNAMPKIEEDSDQWIETIQQSRMDIDHINWAKS